jgi:methionyl-tRNA formyltransferase
MGTPDIAATCLKKILADGFEVVGVYTQPDRPKGRGMKMVASPVKELALANNIPVFQPENFRSDEDVQALRDLKPDVCAVVAYGRILPQRVLDIATLGNVNIHASLLPQYRGSAPYQWAVLDGLKETGVTAQHMALQMDAGDIIDGVIDRNNGLPEERILKVTTDSIIELLGVDIPTDRIVEILNSLELPTTIEGNMLTTKVPSIRDDIEGRADLAEEVMRIYGYDHIVGTKMKGAVVRGTKLPERIKTDKIKALMNGAGAFEIATYSFIAS